jgi:hypothetical protein
VNTVVYFYRMFWPDELNGLIVILMFGYIYACMNICGWAGWGLNNIIPPFNIPQPNHHHEF